MTTQQTYTVVINEYQRNMLADILQAVCARDDLKDFRDVLKSHAGDDSVFLGEDSMYEEMETFLAMLNDMPLAERSTPGCTHGFCC
jgi:hypothetical protein